MENLNLLLTYPVHFLISIIVVLLLEYPIAAILDSMAHHIEIDPPPIIERKDWEELIEIPGRHGGHWIGITERLLFFLFIWSSLPIMIPAWLAFKVASKWESWTNLSKVPDKLDDVKSDLEYFKARTRWSSRTMQRFLVGTGLNLLAAFVGVGLFFILIELQPCIIRC